MTYWGETFLLPMDENGERKRATISDLINTISQDQVSREDQLMKYLEYTTDTGQLENGLYKFKCIKDGRGPCTSSDPEYLGSIYNLQIEWETGEMTLKPISNIIPSDPYTCAVYAEKNDLLNTSGWKLSKRHVRTARRLIRTLKKSKYRQTKASRKTYTWMGSSKRLCTCPTT